jgi:serine/threonine-protein kinase
MSTITEQLKTALAERYVIERELGQGGMATVYLAHDVKHERMVALKVLRPELAAVIGAERFLQEIKVTANLQHSHILPLYDSGAADSFLYYVMPYVEGETLRTKLDREKQLGVDDAVALTRAIAAALEHAHKQEVVHRDIKPENILLRDGDPLIADFGIALAVSHAGGNRLTETGLSIGTPHYMSPEQAMGDRELDARSDVYSLGAVLYEMLTGEPPYTGSTAQAIVARVITEDPRPITLQRRTVPPHVADTVHKALNKLPADRFSSAAGFAEALVTPGYVTPTATQAGDAVAPARRWDPRLLALSTLAAAAVVLAAWGWLRPAPSVPAAGPVRFALENSSAPIALNQGARLLDVSPDGSLIAYVGNDSVGGQALFLRRADAVGAARVEGTAAALQPFFSPDGAWLGFVQESDIKKVRVAGGPALTVARGVAPWGIHWGATNTIIFRSGSGIAVVPAAGGNPRMVPIDAVDAALRWPELLPDGRAALVTIFPSLERAQIAVLDLETGALDTVISQGTHPHYVQTGHVVYGHPDGGVFAVPFDVGARRVTGDPVPVVEDVLVFGGGATQFAASASGTAAYAGGARALDELVLVDLEGRETVLPGDVGGFSGPRFSPDGGRIAFEFDQSGTGSDIYVHDLALSTRSRITFTGSNQYSSWSPDGEWMVFASSREGSESFDAYRRRADGGGSEEALLRMSGEQFPQEFLTDGTLLYRENAAEGGRNVLIKTPADSLPRPLLANAWDEVAPRVSPNGRWVAYSSNETGAQEVYVTSFPQAAGRWQVTQGGGAEPVWTADGSGIYYWAGDRLMMATVATSPTFAVTGRREMLRGGYDRFFLFAQYDVHPDGRQFVMIRNQDVGVAPLVIVANWFTELRQRMAGGT